MGYYDKMGSERYDQIVDAFTMWQDGNLTQEEYIDVVKRIAKIK